MNFKLDSGGWELISAEDAMLPTPIHSTSPHEKRDKVSRRAMQHSCCLRSKDERGDESWIAGLTECG